MDTEILALIREHQLDRLPTMSGDGLDVHARHFAQRLREYAAKDREALKVGNIRLADDEWARFRLAALLYASGLVTSLSRAALKLGEENERLRDHISEQATHLQTRIEDGTLVGATVWRLALEDAVRENRALLQDLGASAS